jgi:hypothetical protein
MPQLPLNTPSRALVGGFSSSSLVRVFSVFRGYLPAFVRVVRGGLSAA